MEFPVPKDELSNRQINHIRRKNHWEDAKCELAKMLNTFWGEREQFAALHREIEIFIKHVEDEGLSS